MPRVVKAKENVAGKKGRAKKKNGYVMPEPIPLGEIITDFTSKQWKVGPSIGCGGFGEIYTACKASERKNIDDYDHVVKIEPHENGPLFVEMHFYMRNTKLEDIKNFCKKKNLKTLGMPHLVGTGSHQINGLKHRFIVIPRYGKDIGNFFIKNNRRLPEQTIYRIAIQMLDVYEYIHSCTYVHGDLKGANILLGFGKGEKSQVYLVDFGLATHYTTKEFKPDPKSRHNGTIEYTSRDAHQGVPTMRGDLEILGYNIIHWSGILLPWEKELKNPEKVQKAKEDFMKNTDSSLKSVFDKVPEPIKQYMKYVAALKYDEVPDYNKCREMFKSALKKMGKSLSGDLEFDLSKTEISEKNVKVESDEDIEEEVKKAKVSANIKSRAGKQRGAKKTPVKRGNTALDDSSSKRAKISPEASTPISSKGKQNSPEISVERSRTRSESSKKPGKTIVNDNLTPKPKSSKTYEFNFELDVSMDANVIVNVNRKKKAKKDDNSSKNSSESSTPVPRVRIRRLHQSPRGTLRSPRQAKK